MLKMCNELKRNMTKYTVVSFDEIDSTNSYALKNISTLKDKTIVFAKKQTNGRGRFNRVWISDDKENIYTSIVLKPRFRTITGSPLQNLTQYMSLVICKTLESYGTTPTIKWPNDVLISQKKISGILAETSIEENKLHGIVLGVGINLNFTSQDLMQIDQKATSLNLEINKNINRDIFFKKLLDTFFLEYDTFLTNGFEYIKSSYIERCSFLRQEILIKNLQQEIRGIATKINDDGSLSLKLADQSEINILAGDIIC